MGKGTLPCPSHNPHLKSGYIRNISLNHRCKIMHTPSSVHLLHCTRITGLSVCPSFQTDRRDHTFTLVPTFSKEYVHEMNLSNAFKINWLGDNNQSQATLGKYLFILRKVYFLSTDRFSKVLRPRQAETMSCEYKWSAF